MDDSWFYEVDGRKGPIDIGTLKVLADNGIISRHTLVWKEGLPEWVPAAKVCGLFKTPPPVSVPTPQPIELIQVVETNMSSQNTKLRSPIALPADEQGESESLEVIPPESAYLELARNTEATGKNDPPLLAHHEAPPITPKNMSQASNHPRFYECPKCTKNVLWNSSKCNWCHSIIDEKDRNSLESRKSKGHSLNKYQYAALEAGICVTVLLAMELYFGSKDFAGSLIRFTVIFIGLVISRSFVFVPARYSRKSKPITPVKAAQRTKISSVDGIGNSPINAPAGSKPNQFVQVWAYLVRRQWIYLLLFVPIGFVLYLNNSSNTAKPPTTTKSDPYAFLDSTSHALPQPLAPQAISQKNGKMDKWITEFKNKGQYKTQGQIWPLELHQKADLSYFTISNIVDISTSDKEVFIKSHGLEKYRLYIGHYNRGCELLRDKYYNDAKSSLLKALSIYKDKRDEELYLMLSLCEYYSGDFQVAEKYYEQAFLIKRAENDKVYAPENSGFEIILPIDCPKADVSVENVKSEVGTFQLSSHVWEGTGGTYGVSITTYTLDFWSKADLKKLMEFTQRGLYENELDKKGKLISSKDIQVNGLTASEFYYEISVEGKVQYGRAILVLAKPKVFIVWCMSTNKEYLNIPEIDKMFESFKQVK